MRLKQRRLLTAIVTILTFVTIEGQAAGQYTKVNRVTVETVDRVQITAWTELSTISFGQDIKIYYQIKNQGLKVIYLVSKVVPEVAIEDNSTILIQGPYTELANPTKFDYSFTKIAPRGSYQGQYIITKKQYERDGMWPINMGFGYVFDISGFDLSGSRNVTDVALNQLLYSRIQVIGAGTLTIEVKESPDIKH